MYKKILCIIFALIGAFGLTSCYSRKAEITTTEYYIVTECIDTVENNVTCYIEYPKLANMSGYYDEINQLIKDTVVEINSAEFTAEDADRKFTFRGEYEIIYHSEDLLSVEFVSYFYAEDAAGSTSSCYGLTVDLKEMEVQTIDRYVQDGDDILREINLQNYEVVYGSYAVYATEELMEEVEELVEDADNSNFCVDDEWLYVIGNDVPGSDYSVIRIKRVAL